MCEIPTDYESLNGLLFYPAAAQHVVFWNEVAPLLIRSGNAKFAGRKKAEAMQGMPTRIKLTRTKM